MTDAIAALRAENEELRETVRQLRAALTPPDVVVPPEWRLTATEARIFRHLASRPMATKASALAALYSDRADGGAADTIINVYICKMRQKLPADVVITTIWGEGWRLEDRHRFLRTEGGVPAGERAFPATLKGGAKNA